MESSGAARPVTDVVTADQALLVRIRNRDQSALAELYDRHARLLFTLAFRIVADRALAEEVLQDTFLQCWNGAVQYDAARGRVAGWLVATTRNRAIDVLRSRSHRARLRERQTPLAEEVGARVGAPKAGENVLLRHAVASALDSLPSAQRQAIELAYYDGLTQTEIAHRQGAALGTVKSRMRAGLDHLREMLRPVLNEPDGTRRST